MPDDRGATGGKNTRSRSMADANRPLQEPAAGQVEPATSQPEGVPPAPSQATPPGPTPPGPTPPQPTQPGPWPQPVVPYPWQAPAIPGWTAQGSWQQQAGWQSPYGPGPGAWQPPTTRWQPSSVPAWSAAPGRPPAQPFGGWQQPGYQQSARPEAWAPYTASWPLGSVPWGYTNPPAVPPVLEPPGNFHPPVPPRPILSLRGRASPGLYLFAIVAGLPGIAALVALLGAATAGFTIPTSIIPRWLILEALCLVTAVGMIAWAIAQARQRRADGWLDYHGPSPWLLLGAMVAVVTAAQLPLQVALKALGVDLDAPPAFVMVLLLLVYLATYFGLVHFLVVRPGALTWRDIARPRRLAPSTDDWGAWEPRTGQPGLPDAVTRWRARLSGSKVGNVLIPLAIVLPLLFATNLFSAAMLMLLGLNPSDIASDQFTANDPFSMLLVFVAVAVLAPVGEETFFRGFATNAWGRSLSRNSAIVRASLFFAFIHIMNTATTDPALSWRVAIFNFGARIPVAFALTWLYMRRRSILASGGLHALYNGLITILTFL